MSSKKYENKTTPTTTTMSKATAKKRVNELSSDRNKSKNAEKITKKTTSEDEIKKSTRPIIKTKDTTKKLVISSRKSTTTKTTTQKQPTTPPSSRVTKTQFFPSKSMYSQALKKQENKLKEPPKIATIKKSSTINKNRDISPDSSSMSERPRTATLRKGSIVNQNIAGPEVPKAPPPPPPVQPTQANLEIEDKYDDDFDSYESDFDEYHSSDSTTINVSEISTSSSESEQDEQQTNQKCLNEDEKKLDSGTYELPEFKQKPSVLNDIKEIIENENQAVLNNFGSLSDEGFEDTKSLQFINFLDAQKKSQRRKTMEMKRKRGEEILSMIKLDVYSFTLLDLQPVPYDVFIKTYGRQNTIQISTQTGDDDLSEETQTDSVDVEDKWTQNPPVFVKIDPNIENFWSLHRSNCIGVGGDSIKASTNKGIDDYNLDDLSKFMANAGNLIVNIQIENRNFRKESRKFDNLPPFSRNCILYETQTFEILKDRSIINAYFSTNRILTIHTGRDDDQRSIICVWRIGDVERPEFLLNAFSETTCCTSDLEASNLIFGGSDDGTVVVWDVKEDTSNHANVQNSNNFQLRTPTFTTEIRHGHNSRIISVLTLSKTSGVLFDRRISLEICSLDENGELIIWGVIRKNQQININNHGLAYWGNIVLTINTRISLQQLHQEIDDFKCTDLLINYLDPTHLYISTNYGFIIHCLTNNAKPKVRKFLPKYQSKINCLEMCPFSSKYFIAAFDNGNLNFYANHIEQPLMILSDKDCTIGRSNIESIQWSHNRPLIFYVKDITNTIHVWDLNVSDMFPIDSTPFNDRIVCMKLSPNTQGSNEDTYMMIATENGQIYLYLLAAGHEQTSLKQYEDDLRKFYNYIERYV